MKKYAITGLAALVSISVYAAKGDNLCDQVKQCNEFWKPLIKQAHETARELQNEWDAMPSWEQKFNNEVFEALLRVQRLEGARKKARNYCLNNGLEKSKEKFEQAI